MLEARDDLMMAVRDRFTSDPKPVSTLIVVGGFTRPEFLVEVEVALGGGGVLALVGRDGPHAQVHEFEQLAVFLGGERGFHGRPPLSARPAPQA